MDTPDDIAPAPPLGEMLARERERLGLSRGEIAQRLHMSVSQVEALEAGQYERLPKGTFLRGFVRNYAKQLGLAADPLLERLHADAPAPARPGLVVASQNIRFDPMGERLVGPYVKAVLLAVVAIALAFAALYWWAFIRPMPPGGLARKGVEMTPSQASSTLAAQPAPAIPQVVSDAPAAAPGAGNGSAERKPAPAAAAAQPPAREAPASPPVAAARGERLLKFRFKGESWVEIRDVQGKVLLSRLNAPGSQAEVAGRPPLTVVIGNAPEVRMTSDDREFPLEPHTRVAVARFTVE